MGKIFIPGKRIEKWTSSGGNNVVIIAPHPDDETIGCGGVALLHKQNGDRVTIVVVTDGRESGAKGLRPDDMAVRRLAEIKSAVEILGAELIYMGLPEGQWTVKEPKAELSRVLNLAQIIYAPSCVDFHPEHVKVAKLIAGLVVHDQIIRIFQIGVPLTSILVNLVVDISRVEGIKKRALSCHLTQATTISQSMRLMKYEARFYQMPAVEVFWQVPSMVYQKIMQIGDWRNIGKCPYRGIRPRPFSDPLSVLAGRKTRRKLRKLSDKLSKQMKDL